MVVHDGKEETKMLTALVLICSLATAPDSADCRADNAESVIRVPQDYASPITCLMHGEAYVAETEIGQNLAADERVKVVCAATTRAAQLVSRTGLGLTRPQ
jgi:hypothetical protein